MQANDTEAQEQPEHDDEHLDSAFSKTVNSSFASLEQMDADELPSNDKESTDGNDLTVTIVLESAKAVNILLTPIFVKIVQEVTEAINAEVIFFFLLHVSLPMIAAFYLSVLSLFMIYLHRIGT